VQAQCPRNWLYNAVGQGKRLNLHGGYPGRVAWAEPPEAAYGWMRRTNHGHGGKAGTLRRIDPGWMTQDQVQKLIAVSS
jgi:hypothetical protein